MVEARVKKELKELSANRKSLEKKGLPAPQITILCNKIERKLEASRPSEKEVVAVAPAKVAEHLALRAKSIELLKNFEPVILEEAHEASCNSYYEILRHC